MLQELDGQDAGACRAKLPELVGALKVDEDDIRLGASLALGRVGKDAVPELVPLLNDPDANVRYYAVWALGAGRAGCAREAVPAVLKALHDPDGDVRRKAIFALGRIKPEATTGVPALVAAFQDNDVEVAHGGGRCPGRLRQGGGAGADPRASGTTRTWNRAGSQCLR